MNAGRELWLWQCERCGAARLLFMHVGSRYLCPVCWRREGSPAPTPAPPSFAQEQQARERMIERGGADRYRVIAGKA
jgi:uncharacterized Zn finger protein (UPF0148 family)